MRSGYPDLGRAGWVRAQAKGAGVHTEIAGGGFLALTSAASLRPCAPSPFRWEPPEPELFRRPTDDLHTSGERFSEGSVTIVLSISSNAQTF